MVTTSDAELADRLRVLRNQGMRSRYSYEMVGGNYRMTELQAAVGLPQMDTYRENVEARRANAAALTEGLAAVPGLVTPRVVGDRGHVWHQYTVRVTDAAAIGRDDLVERLHSAGVGCGVYYPRLVFDHDCFRGHPHVMPADVPAAAAAVREVVSLPVHPGLSASDIDVIISTVVEMLT
jgi:dTDP-4-amino-4,6-dideoxygalactose transaminase